MKIYTLIGRSGTGKSYKALEVSYEKNIPYIIDDGILIKNNKIIAGISAKQAKTTINAVKRAIFEDEKHRNDVLEKIKQENMDSILILGTSKKMIHKIVDRLKIVGEITYLHITDISTEREIDIAKRSRSQGKHIIPVPTVQLKEISSGVSIKPLMRIFKKSNNDKLRIIEKTIIRPKFSYIGEFYINTAVIVDIVKYNITQIDYIDKLSKVEVENLENGINIKIYIVIDFVENIKNIINVQKQLRYDVEKLTCMNVMNLDVYVERLSKNFMQN